MPPLPIAPTSAPGPIRGKNIPKQKQNPAAITNKSPPESQPTTPE